MKAILIIFFNLLFLISNYSNGTVYLHSDKNKSYENLELLFDKLNIQYKIVDTIDIYDRENLYIISDILSLDLHNLPQYYIVYQTTDLNNITLGNFLEKFSNAIAVWDYSWRNIDKYKKLTYNYLYFPPNYEFTDPVILPCLLPAAALDIYKEILVYGNQHDGDISSHLPALFAHTILQNPQIIIEAGVRGGESTFALSRAATFCQSKLIGLDIEPSSQHVYAHLDNSLFLCINDLDFSTSEKVDAVFIDTSHFYEHTLKEITKFVPLLSEHGMLLFHDSNVTPINGTGYERLNNTIAHAPGNTRGVTQAIKYFFDISFDESKYHNFTFVKDQTSWHMIHYPFCNGLSILQKI